MELKNIYETHRLKQKQDEFTLSCKIFSLTYQAIRQKFIDRGESYTGYWTSCVLWTYDIKEWTQENININLTKICQNEEK